MFAIGITSSDIRPPYTDSRKRPFEMASGNRNDYVNREKRTPNQKGYIRYAACLYRARLTNAGHWVWEKTEHIAESRPSKAMAIRDAYAMAWKFGMCRVYEEGIGFKRITT